MQVVVTPKAEAQGLQVKLQLRSEPSPGLGSVTTAVDMRLKAQNVGSLSQLNLFYSF